MKARRSNFKNKWDRGNPENPIPLFDGRCTDFEGDADFYVSGDARTRWHLRVWAPIATELAEAEADSNTPRNIDYYLIRDEEDRRETALLVRGADDSELDALSEEIENRIAVVMCWRGYDGTSRFDGGDGRGRLVLTSS
jgi:hypothetical protein